MIRPFIATLLLALGIAAASAQTPVIGPPPIFAQPPLVLKGQTSAVGATAFYTNNSGTDQLYLITLAVKLTATGTGTSFQAVIGATGSGSLQACSAQSLTSLLGSRTSGCSAIVILQNGEQAFYSVVYSGVTVNPTYELIATVQRLY